MTLLSGVKNNELSNACFKNKIDGFLMANGKKVLGYKDSSKFLITRDIIGINEWNEDEIMNRTQKISDEIVKLWSLDIFQ